MPSDSELISKKDQIKKGANNAKTFFTADMHFGHEGIIQYTNRPFKSINEMNDELVKRWNAKVPVNTLVYHIGDFAFKGSANASNFEAKLNGDIVHIQGNHDKNNGVKTLIAKCIMHFGGKSVFVVHRPPSSIQEIPSGVDFCICGHVHNLWKHKWVQDVPVINVGVDVWCFEPVSITSILKYYDKIRREKHA